MTQSLHVTGMTCGGCENAVKRVLKQVNGVSDVTASHASGTVDVTYDPEKATPEVFKQKIEGIGYQVVGSRQ